MPAIETRVTLLILALAPALALGAGQAAASNLTGVSPRSHGGPTAGVRIGDGPRRAFMAHRPFAGQRGFGIQGHRAHGRFERRDYGGRGFGRYPFYAGAYGLGVHPYLGYRGSYLRDAPVRDTRVVRAEEGPYPGIPSLPGLPTDTGIREAPPSRPALYVINPGRRDGGALRPSAKVVHVGAAASRDDGDWGVPFTGPKIVEVRVPRGR